MKTQNEDIDLRPVDYRKQ